MYIVYLYCLHSNVDYTPRSIILVIFVITQMNTTPESVIVLRNSCSMDVLDPNGAIIAENLQKTFYWKYLLKQYKISSIFQSIK